MNQPSLSLLVVVTAAALFLGAAPRLNSEEVVVVLKTPQEQLIALKAANAELLQRQQKTLQKLDGLKQLADQLRIMAKRS